MDENLKRLCTELEKTNGELLRALETANKNEKLFRDLVEAAPDAKVVIDGAGRIILVNAQTENVFGYERHELLGKPVEVLLPARFTSRHEAYRAAFANSPRARPMGAGMQLYALRKDGTEFPAEISLSPIHTIDGNLVIAAIRDIADRKALEKQLQEKDRLVALGTTAAVFAHEVANPLNGISSALQMARSTIERSPTIDPRVKQDLEMAAVEVERLTSLLNDYRAFARPQHLNRQRTDIRKLLEELLALHYSRKGSGIVTQLEIADQLPETTVDPARIKQAVLNLCANAVEAMASGGTLLLRAYVSQPNLVMEVTDTGTGIPEGLAVFQLFKTTKPKSTGLGLPIVRQIVSEHGGSIDYVSEVGKGTTFRIVLPISNSTAGQRS